MFSFNVSDQRIRPDPRIVVGSPERVESDGDVVIVDETSNPESPPPSSSHDAASNPASPPDTEGDPAGAAPGSLLTRLFMNCPVSATSTPNASPMVSPVASPRPRVPPSAWSSTNPLLTAPPGIPAPSSDLQVLRSGTSFVFPSSDGGSLLVQRLVETTTPQIPPSPRLPTSHVTQHPLRPFPTPRTDPTVPPGHREHGFNLVGKKYLLLDQLEGSHLQRCIDVQSQKEYVCKTVKNDPVGQSFLAAHMRVDGHSHINPVHEVLVGENSTYLIFPPCHVDLHSYVRTKRRLREPQARLLFRQIVSAVHESHSKGIVLRDLKLRKFVFIDDSRINLKLESLEDAVVLEDEEHDLLSDKHGCPAYVSPEILKRDAVYSGRAADMWGLGVMLYTMLVGRYPFHGQEHTGLFAKIRRGQFSIPDSISSRARCLIRCLLRKEPEERLSTEDVLAHPWVNQHSSPFSTSLLSAMPSTRSTSERSNRHHRSDRNVASSSSSSSSSSTSASTPMSVAPPSAVSTGSVSGASHQAPPIHPTLIVGNTTLATAAASGPSHSMPLPVLASNLVTNAVAAVVAAEQFGDQTVPESVQLADDVPGKD